MSDKVKELTEWEIRTQQPEEMSVGKLNTCVRDLREELYQQALKHQAALDAARAALAQAQRELEAAREDLQRMLRDHGDCGCMTCRILSTPAPKTERPPVACSVCHTPIRKFVHPGATWTPCEKCGGVKCEKCCEAPKTERMFTRAEVAKVACAYSGVDASRESPMDALARIIDEVSRE